ncbi:MAG: EutN/CcmL family microcompartment protein [Planctomycetaceae bacterium]|nr:EutN/CcmL family microcompartment protein [Planctomycetaceae bacterium]
MRIAQIIGTVTLNQSLSSLQGNRLKLAVPLSQADLRSTERPMAEPLVVFDDLGAGIGDRIMLSEGGEAAQPFYPEMMPIDAYNAGILDEINLEL